MRVLTAARSRAQTLYAGVINGVRRSLVIAFAVICLLQLMTAGLIGAIVTAIVLWGGDDKLLILLGVFALLFTLPAIGVGYLMSERTWLKAAGGALPVDDQR